MEYFHILLLSAGSLLGQNILDCLENRRSKLRITGLNSESRNPRIFMCDKAYKAPLSTSDGFKDFVIEIVNREKPDLIMPGRDADVLLLAELAELSSEMRKRIPGGSLNAARIINDKWESYRFAVKYGLNFAPSLLPDHSNPKGVIDWARNVGFPVLVKPLQGFGSNGVRIIYEEDELSRLIEKGEDGLILQKILGPGSNWHREAKKIKENMGFGVPLFTCLADDNQYSSEMVIDPDGSLGEIMTCKNLMVMGRCEEAEICDDPDLIRTSENFAASIAKEGWRGMFNLQCRKTDSGFYGFEMNGRLSGSASARGWLGYDEMRELIKAFYDLDIGTDARYIKKDRGIIFRSHADFYTKKDDIKELNERGVWIKSAPCRKSCEKKVLLTGSTGYLGRKLTDLLLRDDRYQISIITGDVDKAKSLFGDKISNYYTHKDLEEDRIRADNGILVHCAFARPHEGDVRMASALQFTASLFSRAHRLGIRSIINVSSKSVYSPENVPPFNEDSVPGPTSVYATSKFSSELLLRSVLDLHSDIRGTSVRLSTICGAGGGLVDVFVLSKFIIRALKGEKIVVRGGRQEFDIIDINDAASALAMLTESDDTLWKPVYNLGSELPYNIVRLAELSVGAASKLNGGISSEIHVDDSEDIYLKNITESSLFRKDFSWKPKVSIEGTVMSMAKQYMKRREL